jgi:hypothetical protein
MRTLPVFCILILPSSHQKQENLFKFTSIKIFTNLPASTESWWFSEAQCIHTYWFKEFRKPLVQPQRVSENRKHQFGRVFEDCWKQHNSSLSTTMAFGNP